MNLNEIRESIAKWNSLRKNKDAQGINALFVEGNSFFYKRESLEKSTSGSYLHVYPGVSAQGKLHVFLIEADRDTQGQYQSKEGILPFITQCGLSHSVNLGDEIPEQEALFRIQDWKDNYSSWIGAQVEEPDNIFQAFAIPLSDVAEEHSLKIYFALKNEGGGGNQIADLIVFDESAEGRLLNVSKYYDMVRPVPPFHVDTPLDQENFFLLEIS